MAQILLLEPDKLLSRVYRQGLEAAGHNVQVASTAQAAIHGADDRRPNLIIMELQLVSHSGIEFLYELRSYVDWRAIPVIVLTTVPAGEFVGSQQILKHELGVDTYLYKPQTTLQKLLQSVQDLASCKKYETA